MNSIEMLETLPGFLREHLDASEPEWIVPPVDGLGAGAWRFRMSAAPHALMAAKILGNQHDELRVNVGLAFDVPYSPELVEHVNHLNEKTLVFGRMFVMEDLRPCAIVMQEIFFGAGLSFDFPPSMQNLLTVTGRLGGLAHRCSSELVGRFGGRPFADEDDMVLTLF